MKDYGQLTDQDIEQLSYDEFSLISEQIAAQYPELSELDFMAAAENADTVTSYGNWFERFAASCEGFIC